MANRKSSLKASFVIKKSGNEQLLQLSKFSTRNDQGVATDEESGVDSGTALDNQIYPTDRPMQRRKSSRFWGKRFIKRLRNGGKVSSDEDLEAFKDLSVSISTFAPLKPYINEYVLVISRVLVLLMVAYCFRKLYVDFYAIIGDISKDELVALKGQKYVIKFFSKFIITSVKADRSLMVIYLNFMPQMTSLLYAYISALFFSIYVIMQGGSEETAKELWNRMEEKKKRLVLTHRSYRKKNSKSAISSLEPAKDFFINRLQGCSARIDFGLGFAFILPVLKFLSNYKFKTIPTIPNIIMIPFILLMMIDDTIISKRKFEIEAIFKLFKMNLLSSILGLAWLFFIRFYVTDVLELKLKSTLSEDFGHAVFFIVIFLFVHIAGCGFKYLLRQFKPVSPTILSVPRAETGL